ncbi:hypothetical protein AC790_13410 [Pantoea sp. RIT-PI-b]|uniref:hypothetical protein n=1 Tax=Pantoea sp. RIT-PI-b TaxID=1681195 RepID=UPI00067623DC|nr:hypothetical protein [Pantoea sp. RIT-PI-b]KNC11561.1 hypothetical protein AC790_13410 [Pantoea sp. RIT-PI-b]
MRADKIKKPNHIHRIIDERGFIFVHRYAWSHSAMRKVTRRMCKDGILLKVAEDRDGFKYIRTQQEGGNEQANR